MEHSQAQCSMLQLRSALEASCSGRTVDECQPSPQPSHLFANGRYRLLREINSELLASKAALFALEYAVHRVVLISGGTQLPLRLAERMSGLSATAFRVLDGARAPLELF